MSHVRRQDPRDSGDRERCPDLRLRGLLDCPWGGRAALQGKNAKLTNPQESADLVAAADRVVST